MIVNLIKKLVIRIIKSKIKTQFKKQSITGDNFSVLISARIHNKTFDRSRVMIGNNCEIGAKITIDQSGFLTIGDNTTIRNNSAISSIKGIKIGECVIISNNVTIRDHNSHPTSPTKRAEMSKSGFYGDLWSNKHAENKEIVIADNVWIGERAVILKGVIIGKGAIVATCSVVTKDVPPFSVVAGNPAKVVKEIID